MRHREPFRVPLRTCPRDIALRRIFRNASIISRNRAAAAQGAFLALDRQDPRGVVKRGDRRAAGEDLELEREAGSKRSSGSEGLMGHQRKFRCRYT